MQTQDDTLSRYTECPVRNNFSDAPVFYAESTLSTMDDARFFLSGDKVHGRVIAAGYQTKGRGRFAERKWISLPGENLLFTLILDRNMVPFPFRRIPLILGLALCRFCEKDIGISPFIKWPNDIIANRKKLAGILCESEGDFIFCGIGLNCNQQEFDETLPLSAVSLQTITVKKYDLFGLLEKLLGSIKEAMETPDWQCGINKRLYGIGEKVKVVFPGDDRTTRILAEGTLSGIDEDGALLIDARDKQPQRVIAGEVVFVNINYFSHISLGEK